MVLETEKLSEHVGVQVKGADASQPFDGPKRGGGRGLWEFRGFSKHHTT